MVSCFKVNAIMLNSVSSAGSEYDSMDMEAAAESSESEYSPGSCEESRLKSKYNQEYNEELLDSSPDGDQAPSVAVNSVGDSTVAEPSIGQAPATMSDTSNVNSEGNMVPEPSLDQAPAMASETSGAPSSTESVDAGAVQPPPHETSARQCLRNNTSHAESALAGGPESDIPVAKRPETVVADMPVLDEQHLVDQSADSADHSAAVDSHSGDAQDDEVSREPIDKTSADKLGKVTS